MTYGLFGMIFEALGYVAEMLFLYISFSELATAIKLESYQKTHLKT